MVLGENSFRCTSSPFKGFYSKGILTPVGACKKEQKGWCSIITGNKTVNDRLKKLPRRSEKSLWYRSRHLGFWVFWFFCTCPLATRSGGPLRILPSPVEQINEESQRRAKNTTIKNFLVSAIILWSTIPAAGNVRELQATILRATLWAGWFINWRRTCPQSIHFIS